MGSFEAIDFHLGLQVSLHTDGQLFMNRRMTRTHYGIRRRAAEIWHDNIINEGYKSSPARASDKTRISIFSVNLTMSL